MTVRYPLHGLVVESQIPLPRGPAGGRDRPADLLIVEAGRRAVPTTLVDGDLLQGVASPERLLHSTVRRPDGAFVVRVHGIVDFEVASDLRSVLAWIDPGCSADLVGILTAGHLLAAVLALRGETVLHASAVEVDGAAVAMVADSGGGKSTLAALACAAGARFVTDDVLRLDRDSSGTVRCWSGPTENRLRRDVAEVFDGAARTWISADGRTVWSPPSTALDRCRLHAVVLPHLDRERDTLALHRLAPAAAVLELTRRPRIPGWCDESVVAQTFRNLAELVKVVPVFTARIPWGPPFDRLPVDLMLERCLTPRGTPQPAL